jgi:hypothetical protein
MLVVIETLVAPSAGVMADDAAYRVWEWESACGGGGGGAGGAGGGGGGGGGTGVTVPVLLSSPQPVSSRGSSTTVEARDRDPSDFRSHLCIVPFIVLLLTKKVGFG